MPRDAMASYCCHSLVNCQTGAEVKHSGDLDRRGGRTALSGEEEESGVATQPK